MLQKLKVRVRKALFAFFKEEIIEAVKYQHELMIPLPPPIDCGSGVVETVFAEIVLEDSFLAPHTSLGNGYETAIKKMRSKLFDEVFKYVKITEWNGDDPNFIGRIRRIRASVKVCKP